ALSCTVTDLALQLHDLPRQLERFPMKLKPSFVVIAGLDPAIQGAPPPAWIAGSSPISFRLRRPEQRSRSIRNPARHARPWAWHPRVDSREAAENAEERPNLRVSASPREILAANSWMPGPSPGMTGERLRTGIGRRVR